MSEADSSSFLRQHSDEPFPRFLADDMVARVGRWLRVLGYDTVIWAGGPDEALLALAEEENRIVVTRDTGLGPIGPSPVSIFLLEDENPTLQLVELVAFIPLDTKRWRHTRCQRCNGLIDGVPKESVREEVPPRSFGAFEEFWRCRGCGQVYWRGDHWESMEKTLAWVESNAWK